MIAPSRLITAKSMAAALTAAQINFFNISLVDLEDLSRQGRPFGMAPKMPPTTLKPLVFF